MNSYLRAEVGRTRCTKLHEVICNGRSNVLAFCSNQLANYRFCPPAEFNEASQRRGGNLRGLIDLSEFRMGRNLRG